LSDQHKMITKKEARLLTKAHSACRKLEFQTKNNCKFGDNVTERKIRNRIMRHDTIAIPLAIMLQPKNKEQ